ncbi:hypothetical protein ABIB51_004159 [Arthrobacter sp. UYCu712]
MTAETLFATRTIVQDVNIYATVIPITRPAADAPSVTARRVPLSKELHG